MIDPSPVGSGSRRADWRRMILISALLITPLNSVHSQEHDDDHDHDHLHFSHPLVTESPSPDTKLRLDFLGSRTGNPITSRENTFRLEAEYAFTHSLSLAVVAPFIFRTAPVAERASGLGNLEVSLKAASVAFGEHGLLLGGGLSAELPTGNDSKGIGSSHVLELEPFVDAGYKRDALEFVGLAALSSTFRRRPGEEAERDLSFDISTLYRIHARLEGLLEVTTSRALIGPESGTQQTFIAPGLKVYPFSSSKLMFGASFLVGTGVVHDTHALLLSGFYHF